MCFNVLFLSGNQYNNKGQGLPISSSFKVKSSGFRIFCGLKPKVIRDATGYGKVNGLDSLLDDIDKVLGVNLMALYSFFNFLKNSEHHNKPTTYATGDYHHWSCRNCSNGHLQTDE